MQVRIWQQFSSNNSSDFTVVGVFNSPEAAQGAAAQVRQIIKELKDWYENNPDEAKELLSSGGYPPSPAEVEMGQRFGFAWEQAVEWYQYASVQVVLDKLVYIMTEDFRPDTAGEPFEKILTELGGQGLLHGNFYGDQIGTILAEITATAPDESTAREIVERNLEFERLGRAVGTWLHLYDWNFGAFNLPEFIAELDRKGCTQITYRLYQSENPGGRTPSAQDADLLIKLLDTPHLYEVDRIARTLGESRDPRAVDALGNALKRVDSSLDQIQIAWALGEIGDPRAVDILIPLLDDQDVISAAHVAAAALAKIGNSRAIEALVAGLRNDRAYESSANALATFGTAARDALIKARSDPDPIFRERVEDALKRLDEWEQGGEQFAALRSEDAELRSSALEQAKTERNVDLLISYIRNPADRDMFGTVAEALGDLGDPRAVPVLAENLGSPGVFSALEKLGAPAVEPLINYVRNDQAEPWIRDSAIRSLARIADPRALDVLIEILETSRDVGVIGQAAEGLSRIGGPRAVDALARAFLHDPRGGGFNYAVAQPLEQLHSLDRLLEPLLEAIQTPDWSLPQQVDLLVRIGDKRAIEPLHKALMQAPPMFEQVIRDALQKLDDEPEG